MIMTNIQNIRTRKELRSWLMENHTTASCAWIPVILRDPDELSYLAVVEEAICFGWIDSTKKRLEDIMYQRISPRKKRGNWTELNKERARRLIRLGLMTPQGEAALPDISEESFAVQPYVLEAIKADAETYANFINLPLLYVRVRIDNIQSYPQGDETYERRLSKFLENTKKNVIYGDWNDGGRLSQS